MMEDDKMEKCCGNCGFHRTGKEAGKTVIFTATMKTARDTGCRQPTRTVAKIGRGDNEEKIQKPFATIDGMQKLINALPPLAIVQAIENQIAILRIKGMKIYDWEQKDRAIEPVRIIGGKAYFFAVRENKED